jgi:hypothetical protein
VTRRAPEPAPLRRPPFDAAAHETANDLAARALALHRQADDAQDGQARINLRRTACALDAQADALVPVEHRRDGA